MTVAVSFEGFDLTSGFYRVNKLNPIGSSNKSTTLLPLARADGSLRVFQSYDSKNIVVEGQIVTSSRTELEGAIDTLKAELRKEEGDLQYDWGSGVRIHRCTVTEFSIDRQPENISFVPYRIVFECESPFATDGTTDTIVNNVNVTAALAYLNLTVGGTYDANPVITVTITAINPSVTASQLTFGNTVNSQYLTVEEIFTAGDVLTIDCDNYRVFHNGVFKKATGQFPSFAVGAGVLEYSDNCTTRNITVTATAERRYL